MGLNRYFLERLVANAELQLSADENHHAFHVRREQAGKPCIVFDGQGHEAAATFVTISKRSGILRLGDIVWRPRVDTGRIEAGVALPKGDRQKDVIEKLVELGVHRFVPLRCLRSVSHAETSHRERWERYALEACKQCERNLNLQIAEPINFADWVHESPANFTDDSTVRNQRSDLARVEPETSGPIASTTLRIICHPDRNHGHDVEAFSMANSPPERYRAIRFAIGPEGGFTSEEVDAAYKAGWKRLDLGERILRVETAVAAACVLATAWLYPNRVTNDDR